MNTTDTPSAHYQVEADGTVHETDAGARARRATLNTPRRAGRSHRLSDLTSRLIARQDRNKAERELSPVRRSIREQVRGLVEGFTGPTPTPERNRQAYVDAVASKRNHLGQVMHVYPGTVSAKTIAHRRARGKMAKASRKANRHG